MTVSCKPIKNDGLGDSYIVLSVHYYSQEKGKVRDGLTHSLRGTELYPRFIFFHLEEYLYHKPGMRTFPKASSAMLELIQVLKVVLEYIF